MLQIKHLSKQYSNHIALDDLSLDIPTNAIFGLLGPNGAGKTTLIRIITQIYNPDKGEVFFNGEPLAKHHTNNIGYLPEERGLYKKMFVKEHLLYIAALRDLSKKEAEEKVNYWLNRFSLEKWAKSEVGSLSKGMQQKVQFIAAILHDPELIILDEPFSGFDPVNQQLLTDEIKALHQAGKTIIFSTHRMESVEEICTHIALIHNANCILKGEVKDIKKQFSDNTSLLTLKLGDVITEEEIVTTEIPARLQQLKDGEEVFRVEKKELSIKEVFIKLVNEKN